jgi:serine/threonine protein kinase/tetratricopeptide (TPR) repeat protein
MPKNPQNGPPPDACAGGFPQDTFILHYRIIRLIGKGAMGEVYLAEDTKLERKVALKFLPPWLSQDLDSRRRIIEEARAASKLNHPNIVAVYSLEEYQGRYFIDMEYVDGLSLKEMAPKPPLETIISITVDICRGLEAAHGAGIVHLDIKPQNILIDKAGRAKICDFGIAIFKGSSYQSQKTSAGTTAYMSPEQAQGIELDWRSDIFSLGTMLYEFISGRTPFEGEYEAALLYSIINEAPKPLGRQRPDLPASLEPIVDMMLKKNPPDRYQSVTDIIDDLRALSEQPVPKPAKRVPLKRTGLLTSIFLLLAALLFLSWLKIFGPGMKSYDVLAVLPFDNLGPANLQYFADGMTDALTSELAKVSSLRIISRTSAQRYVHSKKPIPVIGKELKADYILEGAVLLDTSTIPITARINPQLIAVVGDTLIWVKTYVRSVEKIITLQSEIALDVTRELDIKLHSQEKASLGKAPTADIEAYFYYLRGIYYYNRSWREQDVSIAIQMYLKAIERDSSFALAYAMLSRAHSVMYWEYYDRTEGRLSMARNAIDRALLLNPGLPEARMALGTYYYSIMNFDSAMIQFRMAEKSQPHNSDLLGSIAGLLRREGDFRGALRYYLKAYEVDPRSQLRAFDIGLTYSMLRDYRDSRVYLDEAIDKAPDWPLPYIYKAWLYIFSGEEKDKARQVLARASNITDLSTTEYYEYYWWLSRILDGDFNRTLDKIVLGNDSVSYYLAKGRIYYLGADSFHQRAYFDSAKTFLAPLLRAQPYDPRFHGQLGLACAGLGQTDSAILEGRKAVELLPLERDAYNGQFMVANLAEIYVMIGQYDQAMKQLSFLLSEPGFTSIPYLKADPIWAPLLKTKEFKRLASGH